MTTRLAYHWEGNETFEVSGQMPLSMIALNNDRVLFLCNNAHEWSAAHLLAGAMRCYQVEYQEPERVWTTGCWGDYVSLFHYGADYSQLILTDQALQLIAQGYRKFELLSENDRNELSEFFLIEPRNYVTAIRPYTPP